MNYLLLGIYSIMVTIALVSCSVGVIVVAFSKTAKTFRNAIYTENVIMNTRELAIKNHQEMMKEIKELNEYVYALKKTAYSGEVRQRDMDLKYRDGHTVKQQPAFVEVVKKSDEYDKEISKEMKGYSEEMFQAEETWKQYDPPTKLDYTDYQDDGKQTMDINFLKNHLKLKENTIINEDIKNKPIDIKQIKKNKTKIEEDPAYFTLKDLLKAGGNK